MLTIPKMVAAGLVPAALIVIPSAPASALDFGDLNPVNVVKKGGDIVKKGTQAVVNLGGNAVHVVGKVAVPVAREAIAAPLDQMRGNLQLVAKGDLNVDDYIQNNMKADLRVGLRAAIASGAIKTHAACDQSAHLTANAAAAVVAYYSGTDTARRAAYDARRAGEAQCAEMMGGGATDNAGESASSGDTSAGDEVDDTPSGEQADEQIALFARQSGNRLAVMQPIAVPVPVLVPVFLPMPQQFPQPFPVPQPMPPAPFPASAPFPPMPQPFPQPFPMPRPMPVAVGVHCQVGWGPIFGPGAPMPIGAFCATPMGPGHIVL